MKVTKIKSSKSSEEKGACSIRFEAMKVNSSVLLEKEMDDKDNKIDGDKAGKELKKLRSEEIIRDIEVEP